MWGVVFTACVVFFFFSFSFLMDVSPFVHLEVARYGYFFKLPLRHILRCNLVPTLLATVSLCRSWSRQADLSIQPLWSASWTAQMLSAFQGPGCVGVNVQTGLVTHSPYILPKFMFLNLPRDVNRSIARFRLHVHTLHFETATWSLIKSPTCDLCDTDDV
jgi:hypothetical protein